MQVYHEFRNLKRNAEKLGSVELQFDFIHSVHYIVVYDKVLSGVAGIGD
jgi:hypothetical protein